MISNAAYRAKSEEACPIKKKVIGETVDMISVRELTGGLYFGMKNNEDNLWKLVDTLSYNEMRSAMCHQGILTLPMKREEKKGHKR